MPIIERSFTTTDFCPAGEGAGRTEETSPKNVYIKIIAPQPDSFDPYYQQSLEDSKHHGEIIHMQYTKLEENEDRTLIQ